VLNNESRLRASGRVRRNLGHGYVEKAGCACHDRDYPVLQMRSMAIAGVMNSLEEITSEKDRLNVHNPVSPCQTHLWPLLNLDSDHAWLPLEYTSCRTCL
jgi:hypothetical protein